MPEFDLTADIGSMSYAELRAYAGQLDKAIENYPTLDDIDLSFDDLALDAIRHNSALLVTQDHAYGIEKRQLLAQSRTDTLTGLPNRRGIENSMSILKGWSDRTRIPIGIFFVDFDRFKQINDRLGHMEGDKAFVGLSAAIAERLRVADVMGRYGGDEFVILAPLTQTGQSTDKNPDERAQALLEDLQEGSAAYFSNEPKYNLPGVGASFGYTIYDPDNPRDPLELLNEADRMMYQQKENRRTGV